MGYWIKWILGNDQKYLKKWFFLNIVDLNHKQHNMLAIILYLESRYNEHIILSAEQTGPAKQTSNKGQFAQQKGCRKNRLK